MVDIRIIDIAWLFRDEQTFIDLVEPISKCERNAVFESVFVVNLLDMFWDQYKDRLIKKLLIPYFAYAGTAVVLICISVNANEDRDTQDHILIATLSAASLAQWTYQLYTEAV